MDAIRVKNLRSIRDTETVEMKPLTILVGGNSSGKSTFLRTFPLLRQSVEIPTQGPLLWYGRYVDFGSHREAVRRNARDAPVEVSFSVQLRRQPHYGYGLPFEREFSMLDTFVSTITISLMAAGDGTGSYISAIRLELDGWQLEVRAGEDGACQSAKINGRDLPGGEKLSLRSSAYILPSVVARESRAATRRTQFLPYAHSAGGTRLILGEPPFVGRVIEALRPLVHRRTSSDKLAAYALSLQLGSREAMLAHLQKSNAFPEFMRRKARELTVTSPRFIAIRDAALLNAAAWILAQADREIAGFFANVRYMLPLRVPAERYYRAQDLSVREVDFQGENLAMFLQSLTQDEQHSFAEFFRSIFGFHVSAKSETGHIALQIHEREGLAPVNLADAGFGYSQVFPVIAQLWSAVWQERMRPPSRRALVAIEQPELHLHPAFQARLGDLFSGAIALGKQGRAPLSLIVETHSEALVNRLGELVGQQGHITAEDVQILIFNRSEDDHETTVTRARFDEEGRLLDWPYGFFSPIPQ